jgi:toxin ParE1/3/4
LPQVTRRPLAETDILEIWDYSADDNPAAADRWVDQLDEQFQMRATQPMMGRARDELAPGVRSFPFGRYVVFYVPLDHGIDVVRVLHGARDIDAVFHPER